MKKVLPLLMLLVTASFYGCGGSNAQTSQPDENNPPTNPLIASNVLLGITVRMDGDRMNLVETQIKRTSSATTPHPILAGEYAVFVVDRDGNLQFVTMFSLSGKGLGEGVDPATGKRFGVWVDMSSLPASFTLPVNAKTKEIYILDKDKQRVLDIPIDPSEFETSHNQSSSLEKTVPIDRLHDLYPNIEFRHYNASWNIECSLHDDSIAQYLINGLDYFRNRNILMGIDEVIVVSKPVDFWLKLEGAHRAFPYTPLKLNVTRRSS